MRQLVICGAGGHGKVVAEAAELIGRWSSIVFVDNLWPKVNACAHWKVVAGEITALAPSEKVDFVVAIGDNRTRALVFDRCLANGFRPASVIHPSAVVSSYAEVGPGSVVFAGSVINIGAKIGACCIINTGSTIDHDCVIGKAVHISPGANLAGSVKVGDYSWIGIGACLRQALCIGVDVVVGAGACVVSDILKPGAYVGVPARQQDKLLRSE